MPLWLPASNGIGSLSASLTVNILVLKREEQGTGEERVYSMKLELPTVGYIICVTIRGGRKERVRKSWTLE